MTIELLLGSQKPEEVVTFLRQAKINFNGQGIPSFPLERPEMTRTLEGMAAIITDRIIQQERNLGNNVPKLCVIGGGVLPEYETPMEGYAYSLSAMVAARISLATADPKATPIEALKGVGRVRVGFTTEKKMRVRSRSTRGGTIEIPSLAHWRIIGDVNSLQGLRCLIIVDQLDVGDNGEMAARIAKGIMSKKIQGDAFDYRTGPRLIANVIALSVLHEGAKVEQLFKTRLEHREPEEEDSGYYCPKILTFLALEKPAPVISHSSGSIPAFKA